MVTSQGVRQAEGGAGAKALGQKLQQSVTE